MKASTIVLKASEVVKTYGKKENTFVALKGVSLDIKEGESIAIIGKSGSGKSTLMHILAALDRPDSGALEFGGKDVESFKDRDLDKLRNREFGFIFQQFFLNYRETVLENVMLPLKIGGVRQRERKRRAMEALAEVDITNKANNKASDLSGGQKQRACIARALVTEPSVIFADEPTGNLDSENGQRVEDLLFDLNKKRNITLIIVTHDEDLAAKCDRRLYMKDGILTEGDNHEADRPRSNRKPKPVTL
jgi:putative ABC transport system ATP-binding protein